MKKILVLPISIVGFLLFFGIASASVADIVQPASAADIGKITPGSQGSLDPFVGDHRVDGRIFSFNENDSNSTPVVFADSLVPELDLYSNFGSEDRRWGSGFFRDLNVSETVTSDQFHAINGIYTTAIVNNSIDPDGWISTVGDGDLGTSGKLYVQGNFEVAEDTYFDGEVLFVCTDPAVCTPANQLALQEKFTPSSTLDPAGGFQGNFAWDDNYFYIKTSVGWKRTPLSTF